LGGIVEAYDVRPETKEQIESLGAKAIDLNISNKSNNSTALELTASEKEQQQKELANHIASADIFQSRKPVICQKHIQLYALING